MARGKNNRRRASIDGPAPNMTTHHGNCSNSAQPAPGTPTTHQEISEAIEFHWKNLSLDLKSFLLKNPQELSLRKFVDYWNNPVRVENTSPNIAASICGCSWYLALNYMTIGQVVEARALILNGCFLQQCYVSLSCDVVMCIWCMFTSLGASSPISHLILTHLHVFNSLFSHRTNPLKKLPQSHQPSAGMTFERTFPFSPMVY